MKILLSIVMCSASLSGGTPETSCQTYVFPMEDVSTIEMCEERSSDMVLDITTSVNKILASQGILAYPVLFGCVIPGEDT